MYLDASLNLFHGSVASKVVDLETTERFAAPADSQKREKAFHSVRDGDVSFRFTFEIPVAALSC